MCIRDRPHGTRQHAQLRQHGPVALTGGSGMLDALDAAVRAEAGRLAAHISPEALDRLQRDWRAAGKTPAADAAGLLTQVVREAADMGVMPRAAADSLVASLNTQATVERRAADLEAAQPDTPGTPGIDEHHQAQARAQAHTDLADADLAAAGARQRSLMSQSFPPLTTVGKVPAHVAAKTPANLTVTQRKARTR